MRNCRYWFALQIWQKKTERHVCFYDKIVRSRLGDENKQKGLKNAQALTPPSLYASLTIVCKSIVSKAKRTNIEKK